VSIDAIRWALKQDIRPSSCKFVLVAMADRADERHCCFPSTMRLCKDTSLDRKTVLKSLRALVDAGIIQDTGMRRGRTKAVRVWRMNGVSGRDDSHCEILHSMDLRKSSAVKKRPEAVPKTAPLSSPKNGTACGGKLSRFSLSSSPKNGTPKLSQKRDTEPTSINLPIEPTTTGAVEELNIPDILEGNRVVVVDLIQGLDQDIRQGVIDELASKVSAGKVRSNVPAYLAGMVSKIKRVGFHPTAGSGGGLVKDWQAIPDNDLEIVKWAQRFGYQRPKPGQGYSDYRLILREAISTRMRSEVLG